MGYCTCDETKGCAVGGVPGHARGQMAEWRGDIGHKRLTPYTRRRDRDGDRAEINGEGGQHSAGGRSSASGRAVRGGRRTGAGAGVGDGARA
eukprot:COSAG02_NODE_3766_length_6268_cov_9.545145_7_plen_92_part_00